MLLLVGLPCALAWAIRRVRVEGRSLPPVALGWLSLWSQPTSGIVGGRPVREGRARRAGGRAFLAGGGT